MELERRILPTDKGNRRRSSQSLELSFIYEVIRILFLPANRNRGIYNRPMITDSLASRISHLVWGSKAVSGVVRVLAKSSVIVIVIVISIILLDSGG